MKLPSINASKLKATWMIRSTNEIPIVSLASFAYETPPNHLQALYHVAI